MNIKRRNKRIFKAVAIVLTLTFNLSPVSVAFAETPTTTTPGAGSTNGSAVTAPQPTSGSSNISSTNSSGAAAADVGASGTSASPSASPHSPPPPSGGSGNSPTIITPNVFSVSNVAPHVDSETGALTEKIPLDIPPGRNGVQPDLELEYNSQQTDQDGEVGYGWSLSIPYIERLNKTGSQNLYGSTAYFTSSLDGELEASTTQATSTSVNILVVGGGGGGSGDAANDDEGDGGGGAGGMYVGTYTFSTSTAYTITVGAGGNGGTGGQSGSSGGNSVFGTITATGGGGGGYHANGLGGGSGGGGGACGSVGGSGTAGQGNAGGNGTCSNGYKGGGGGGAGAAGGNAGSGGAGNGGNGTSSSISGTATTYAGGGGGSDGSNNGTGSGGSGGGGNGAPLTGGNGSNGTANTGGGGGAGMSKTATAANGGNGGSGIVIISAPSGIITSATGGTHTQSGGYDIWTFTSSGTFTVNTINVPGTASNPYGARVDDGSFRQYNYSTSTNAWTMFDKSGTEYLFGSSLQSQQSATTSTSTVYKWMLEKEIDPNGNYVKYTYNKDGNQIYPYQISYTGSGSTDGPMTVTFATSTRTDKTISFKPSFEVDTNYYISQITAAVSGNTVRQYNLSYTTGNNGQRSLLSSLQENGFDDNGVETTLPAMTFGYVSSSTPFVAAVGQGTLSGDPYIAADVNGDGINDSTNISCNSSTGPESGYIYQDGTTSTTFTPPQVNSLCWSFGSSSTGGLNETGTRFLDVNADGKASIVQGSYSTTTSSVTQMYTNTSTSTYSWATTTPSGVIPYFEVQSGSSYYTSGVLGDTNGDGLPDFVLTLATSTGVSSFNGTYYGNGAAWNPATTTQFVAPFTLGGGPDCTNSQLVDVNGDGLADWAYTDGTSTYVYLNNGAGWNSTPDSRFTLATSTVYKSGGTCYDRGMRFVDLNGDGLPDFIRSYNAVGTAGLPETGSDQFVYLNTGHGWATSTAYTLPYIINNPAASSTVTYQEFANYQGNGQQNQDVLSTITYPKGGSTSVTYGYTTQSGTNSQLPYNLLVVTSIVNHDGFGSNEETDYSYSGGLQYLPSNIFDRKFAGFASVTASTTQATTITYYSQGATSTAIVAGDQSDGYGQLNHPYREDTLTPSGTEVQKIFYQYNPIFHPNGEFVGLTRQLEQDYAANGAHQDKDTEFAYSTTTDDLIQTLNYGQVNGNSDGTFSTSTLSSLRTTDITYAASSTINLTVPVEKTLFNSGNASTTDSLYFYDSLPFGQVNVGNQTKEEDWIRGSSYASSTKTYNSYGLVATSTDRDGNATSYVYESLNLYPATTTNALSQSTTDTYDYSNGKIEKAINPNSGITKDTYDGLGRLIEVDQSNPASPATLTTSTTYQFNDTSQPPSSVHETDYLNAATSTYAYDYYDGLGRLVEERKSSENNATSTVTDYLYNAAGKLASQSLPYFALGTSTPPGTKTVNLLVVAGGGGGAGDANLGGTGGGGGGAGGMVTSTFNVSNGVGYTVTVGAGGSGGVGGNVGSNGNNSAFSTVTATGGGGGGRQSNGSNGGSGGGAGGSGTNYSGGNGTTGQGNSGGANNHSFGWVGGGGGGAGAAGGGGSTSIGGNGGNGSSSSISGSSVTYAGGGGGAGATGGTGGTGGGGAAASGTGNGTAGTANTGGGGGAGIDNAGGGRNGGAGGSGIVVVSSSIGAITSAMGGTHTQSGGNDIWTFTSSSTFTPTLGGTFVPTTTPSLYTNYTYDPLGRVATIANAVGTTTNTYASWETTTTDPNGNIKDYILDAYGNLAQVVEHGNTSNATTTYTYDAANDLATTTDALGNVRGYTYDGLGNKLTQQDLHAPSDGTFGAWSYSYDPQGNLTSEADPDSHTITHTFDALNRMLTESLTGSGTQITNTYDSCTNGIGELCTASSTAAKNTYTYDVLGRATNATTTIAGTGYGLSYSYDRQGNVTNLTNSNGSQIAYTYNTAGLVSAVNRTSGGTNSLVASMFNFAPTSQLGQVLFGSNASTTYTYNPAALYRPTRIYTLGAPVGTTTQAIQDLNYTYDPDGNILTRTDNSNTGGGQVVTYTYDKLNRLLSASTTVSNTSSYNQMFTYDALGNILTGPAGVYSYQGNTGSSYANPDAVTQIVLTKGGSAPTIAYDNSVISGNGTPVSSLTFSFTTGTTTSNDLMVVEVQESPPTGSCSTDKVTGVKYNGVSLTDAGYYVGNTSPVNGALKTYDGFAPATSTHNVVVSASASCIVYATAATYSGVKQSGFPDSSGTGNPLNDSGAVTLFQATTTTANNNAWAILVGVPSQSGTATAGSNTTIRQQQSGDLYYADSNGPVSPAGPIGLNWSTASSTHWLANYFSITPVTSYPGSIATTTLGYDNNGNLLWTTTGATTTNYAYDYLNRLVGSRTTGASATTTYAYDAFGNRVSQSSGNSVTAYPNNFYSITTLTNGTTTTATSTEYISVPSPAGNNSLLATVDQKILNGVATGTPVTRYVHPDNIGSTAVTSDANGKVAQSFDYAPYGSVLASTNTGTTTAARQWIGQFSDASGLSYLNARYFSPTQGQFLNEDPVFLAVGSPAQVQQITHQEQNLLLADPQRLNAYSYGRDNPVTLSDPNGKFLPFIVVLGLVFEAYSVAQGGVDAYNYYNMNIKYANVTSQQEKDDAKLNLGFDAVSEATGQGLERAGLEVSGLGLSALQAGNDASNAYGGSVYNYFSNLTGQGSKLLPSISMLTGSWISFPTVVQQGNLSYYRNSSGLLSSTSQSTESTQTNSYGGSQGGGSSQSKQGYNILPGQFNPFMPH